jgi:pilus assembly protein TadC
LTEGQGKTGEIAAISVGAIIVIFILIAIILVLVFNKRPMFKT